jgi:hypothetical protein
MRGGSQVLALCGASILVCGCSNADDAADSRARSVGAMAPVFAPSSTSSTSSGPIELPFRPALEGATWDPFAAQTPAQAPGPAVAASLSPKPAPSAPSPTIVVEAAAPALNLRFTGRMAGPDGKEVIFATAGESVVMLTQGKNLLNGYEVLEISATSVELRHALTNTRARLDLPVAPRYQIR